MTKQADNNVELVSDMMSRYPDEWVFFEVIEYDQYERPYKGILRAHHPDRDKIHEIVMGTDREHFAVWYTGRIVPEGREEVACGELPPKLGLDGVLGLNFLRHFDLRINFREEYIELR